MEFDKREVNMEKRTDEEHMNDPIEAGDEVVPKRVGNKDLRATPDEDFDGVSGSGTMSYDEFYG